MSAGATRAEKIAELVAIKRAVEAAPKSKRVLTDAEKRARSDARASRKHEAEAWAKRHAELIAIARGVVATGKCPTCGSKLRRNLSLAGWWQCEQSGAPTFRARPNDPPCGWQTFTE